MNFRLLFRSMRLSPRSPLLPLALSSALSSPSQFSHPPISSDRSLASCMQLASTSSSSSSPGLDLATIHPFVSASAAMSLYAAVSTEPAPSPRTPLCRRPVPSSSVHTPPVSSDRSLADCIQLASTSSSSSSPGLYLATCTLSPVPPPPLRSTRRSPPSAHLLPLGLY